MFDDFRQQAEESDFEEQAEETLVAQPAFADSFAYRQEPPRYFLGMTPVQRFIIALELFFIVCISGGFLLLVFERVVPPFLYF